MGIQVRFPPAAEDDIQPNRKGQTEVILSCPCSISRKPPTPLVPPSQLSLSLHLSLPQPNGCTECIHSTGLACSGLAGGTHPAHGPNDDDADRGSPLTLVLRSAGLLFFFSFSLPFFPFFLHFIFFFLFGLAGRAAYHGVSYHEKQHSRREERKRGKHVCMCVCV